MIVFGHMPEMLCRIERHVKNSEWDAVRQHREINHWVSSYFFLNPGSRSSK